MTFTAMLTTINTHSLTLIICWMIINNALCVPALQLRNNTKNVSSFESYPKIFHRPNGVVSSDSSNAFGTTTATMPITTTRESDITMSLNAGFAQQGHKAMQLSDKNVNWERNRKRSIPVLEPVKHLLHGVRTGNLTNHTSLFNWQQLFPIKMQMQMQMQTFDDSMVENQTSAAIETKEEREMVNVSTNLRILEFLGSIGSKVWALLRNLRQGFTNFIGNASAASSI